MGSAVIDMVCTLLSYTLLQEANIVDTSFDGNTLAITRASAVPVSSVVSGLSYFCGGLSDIQAPLHSHLNCGCVQCFLLSIMMTSVRTYW